jgi:hypothetical protein
MCLLVGGLAFASPQGVRAQQGATNQPTGRTQQVQQAYRGLFGAGSAPQPGGHALDLTVSVYEEYGNNIDDETPTDVLVLDSGWFTGVRGGLSFEQLGQRARFGLRTEGAFRYYQDSGRTTKPRLHVDMAVDSTEGTRRNTTWHLGGSVDHQPYYMLPLFTAGTAVTGGTAILPTSRDDLLYANARMVYGQSFSVEHQLNPRWTFGVFEDLRYTKADNAGLDVRAIHAGARFGRRFTRYAALRLGYAYQTGRYGQNTDERLETHDIDVSFDYRRPLPRLRRTTFGFATGSSRVTDQHNARWEVVGMANLRHDFEGGWFVQGDFARNVRLVEGFSRPFLQNTWSASLGGFLGRRVELLTSGGYSRGSIGSTSDRYRAIQGAARLRLALARYLAIDTEGLINEHHFGGAVVLPGTVTADLNRWSVRCNVTVWLPLSR